MSLKENYRKILLIILLIGILLCGVGVGIAFSEWSSFEYLGEKTMGGKEKKTDTLTEKIEEKEGKHTTVYIESLDPEETAITLETSKKVPEDEIRFIVEYNPNNVKEVHIDKEELEDQSLVYYISPVSSEVDSFEMFMNCKDELLENIKEKKFYNYTYDTIQSIKVVVHPSNKDFVEWNE